MRKVDADIQRSHDLLMPCKLFAVVECQGMAFVPVGAQQEGVRNFV